MKESKTAILLGATGLTGGLLLDKLIKDERYKKIKVFTRSHLSSKHEKIEEFLIDLFELEKFDQLFTGDEVFCCIGTTKSKSPDKETYRKIDFGIPATAARLSDKNGIKTFVVISALGANEKSKIFYNKVKGEMEGAVLDRKIERTYIFQPSLISGERKESRPLETATKKFMNMVDNLLVGKLKKYRSIHPDTIAEAMIYVANNPYKNQRIESEEIKRIVNKEE